MTPVLCVYLWFSRLFHFTKKMLGGYIVEIVFVDMINSNRKSIINCMNETKLLLDTEIPFFIEDTF